MTTTLTIGSIALSSMIWLWMIRQIFVHAAKSKLITITVRNLISISAILALHYLQDMIPWGDYISIGLIVISLLSIVIYRYKKRSIWRLMHAWIWIIVSMTWWSAYAIPVFTEESLKRTYIKSQLSQSLWYILVFGMMSGLSFGIIENIVYLISWWSQWLIILWQRSLLPIIIHIAALCSTILIAYKAQNYIHPIISRSIAWASGILLHLLYNITQTNWNTLLSGLLIIISLITIHYSLMKSDLLYIDQSDDEK